MFNIFKKTSLVLLIASTALIQTGCKKDDPEPVKIGNWQKKGFPSFGGSRRVRAVSFVIGNKGYIGLGLTNGTPKYAKDIWSYDAGTKIWKQIADYPGSGRSDATAFVVKGKAYVGTGYEGTATEVTNGYRKDFYSYDPTENEWKKIADFVGGTRQYATAFSLNDKGYVGLGFNETNYYQSFYQYTPETDTWKEIANFTGGKRIGSVSFVIDNKAYVGFGTSNSGGTSTTNDIYEFDPAGSNGEGSWQLKDNEDDKFPSRSFALALVIKSKAYAIGGSNSSDVWEYTPSTNKWLQATSFEGGTRGFAGGFAIDNLGYLGTGNSSGSGEGTDDFWVFDPTAAQVDND